MRTRLFDSLLPLIPLLALISAMPLSVAMPVLAVIFVGWPVWRDTPSLLRAQGYHLLWPLGAIGWMIGSALWSIDPGESISVGLRIVLLCILGFLGIEAARRATPMRKREASCYLLLFGLCALALTSELLPTHGIIALASQLFHGDYPEYMRKTVNRGLCAFSVLVWPTMFLLYRSGKEALAWGLFALVALPIFAMQSLSAQLGIAAGLGTFLVCRFLPRAASRPLVILIPGLFFAVPYMAWILLSSPTFAPHVAELNAMGSGRLPIWETYLDLAHEKPLTGWGLGTTSEIPLTQETLDKIGNKEAPRHPHLSGLQLALETGIVGLALVSFCLGSVLGGIAAAARPLPHYALSMATVAAYLGAGLSSFSLWQNWWIACAWLAAMLWARFARAEIH